MNTITNTTTPITPITPIKPITFARFKKKTLILLAYIIDDIEIISLNWIRNKKFV